MISGLKGYGVKDLTQYLMDQVCSCTTITLLFLIELQFAMFVLSADNQMTF